MNSEKIENLFKQFKDTKIMIVGDLMLDIYTWGSSDRLSPEAPVPVVDVKSKEYRLGGAGNVAKNASALGASTIICGVIGDDIHGGEHMALLEKSGIEKKCVLKSNDRKTTTKHRVISNGEQVVRVDEEDIYPLSTDDNAFVITSIEDNIKSIDALVLQDYEKGVLHEGNIQVIIDIAKRHNVPVIVDPKDKNFLLYKNVDLFKPNLREFSGGLQKDLADLEIDAVLDQVGSFKEAMNIENVLLTMADKGLCVHFGKEDVKHVPTTIKQVVDVSGAGDTVISVASLLFANNIPPEDIGIITNLAGGVVCGKEGVVCITSEELLEEVKKCYG